MAMEISAHITIEKTQIFDTTKLSLIINPLIRDYRNIDSCYLKNRITMIQSDMRKDADVVCGNF